MRIIPRFLAILLAAGILAACTLSFGQPSSPPLSVNDRAATMVASTMSALTAHPVQPPATVAPEITATVKPTLFINTDQAACRSGPGPNFRIVVKLPAGTSLDLVARDSADNFWIVLDPISHQQCWISIQDATPTGSFQALPDYTPAPPSVQVPAKPAALRWGFNCLYSASGGMTVNVELGWTSLSKDVNGFRIYRSGTQIADLPADASTFTDKADVASNTVIIYAVEAYNDAGASPRAQTPQAHNSAGDPVACNTP